MSRETLCCVFQVLSFGMDPLFWVFQKAKIWLFCINTASMRQDDHFSQTKKKSENPVIDIIDFR